MKRGSRSGSLILGGFSFLVFSAQLFAPHDAAADWSATAEAKVLYTDNVFELSSSRRLSLSEDPSQPAIVPVQKPGDVVWEPSLDVRHTSHPTHLGPTEVSLKAQGFIFTDNPLFNHGNYRIQVQQALDAETSLLLRSLLVLALLTIASTSVGAADLAELRVSPPDVNLATALDRQGKIVWRFQ